MSKPQRVQEIQGNYLIFDPNLDGRVRQQLQRALLEGFKAWDQTTVNAKKGYEDSEPRSVADIKEGELVIRPQAAFISPDRKWFAKEKWAQPLMRKILRENGLDRMFGGITVDENHKRLGQSLLREFSQGPEIGACIGHERIQKIIKEFGFKSIQLVQPVAGKLNKSTGLRTVVYPYVEGVNLRSRSLALLRSGTFSVDQILALDRNLTNLEAEIRNYLFEAGWVVFDISDRNLILSPDNRLYLIDIEFSRRRLKGESFDSVFLRKK